MKRVFIAVATAAAILAGQGSAQAQEAPPEGIVWMALRDINESYFDPEDPTNRPPLLTAPPEGMIRAVDVSHDGRSDWLVDYGAAELSRYCGTGGCLQRLYVSDGPNYVRAFDEQALSLTVGEGRIEAWVHHLYCEDDRPDCRYIYEWDPGSRRLVERSTTSPRPMGDEAFVPLRSTPD